MTASKEGEPTVAPAWAPGGADRFPVEVLVVWSVHGGWHVDRVLYRVDQGAVIQHAAWAAPQVFAEADEFNALWEYLRDRGGNYYSWELYDVEVARPQDIEAAVATFEAYVAAAGHPIGPPAGTIQFGDGGDEAAAMPFVVLSDDAGHARLVASEHLTGDAVVIADSGTVLPVEFHSAKEPARSGSVSWPLVPAVDYCVRWADRMARLRVHDDATIDVLAIGEPGDELPQLPSTGELPAHLDASSEPSSLAVQRATRYERVPVPDWVRKVRDPQTYQDTTGEAAGWTFAIPWLHHALATPTTYERMPAAPRPGDDVMTAAGYWSPLLYLLRYLLGWRRPDRGLRWWYDADKPTEDQRLRLVADIYDADGQLDWFAGWLWSDWTVRRLALAVMDDGDTAERVKRDWIERQRAGADASGIPSPISAGGNDPLHLSRHYSWPSDRPPGQPLLVRSNTHQRQAVLRLDSMVGWYRVLADHGADLPELGHRSWHVDVVVSPVGWLGTFRRSRETGQWFAGRHSLHVRGN